MKSFLLFALLLLCAFESSGQSLRVPLLERKVTISLAGEKLPGVLTRIGQQGNFSFSYNATIISPDQMITAEFRDKSVREILNQIFEGTLTYREKSSHLILTRTPVSVKKTTAVLIISGYIEDEATGKKVADASVYDRRTLSSAVTNEYGYYKIKLDPSKKSVPLQLSVSKSNYKDTLVMITATESQYITIAIKPIPEKDSVAITVTATSDSVKKEEIKFPYESEANVQNIHDTLYREVQISILPFVGSNGSLSANIINDYSINFFGGISRGTRRIELGFFFNADYGDVSYLQIAGLGNLVYRNVYGVQAAGLINLTGGDVRAIQFSGITNINLGEARGIQAAGIANINNKSADGVLVAGLVNIVNEKSEGLQIAGLGNIQVRDYVGSQISGLTNIAGGKINGTQVSGLFNHARTVRGSQIGLINYADSLSGIPIGLVSIVSSGYHQLEFSADEVFYTNAAFRTGVRQFYNIIAAGVQPESMFGNNKTVWSFGYGLGTAPRLNRWLSLNLDLTTNKVNRGGYTQSLSLLNKLYVGVEMRIARKFSITLGGTVNGYLSNPTYENNPVLFTDYKPSVFSGHNFNSKVNMKMWFGAKVGLRFL